MKFLQLIILQWSKDPTKYIVESRPSGVNVFEDAPAFMNEWTAIYSTVVLSPLYRPIPVDNALFLAEKKQAFPYNTIAIREIKDVFNPSGRGVYFIAPWSVVDKLRQIIE